MLRGWAEQAARIDGSARLANIPANSLLAPFVAEQRAAMLLSGERDRRSAAADRPGARSRRAARGAAAARLRRGAGQGGRTRPRAGVARRRRSGAQVGSTSTGRSAGSRSTAPPRASPNCSTGIAIGLARGDDRALPLSLVQIARHAAPASSEAHLLGALFLEQRGHAPAALAALARVPADDPFAEDALDASARLLLAREARRRGAGAGAAQREPARRQRGGHARLGNVLDELGRHAEAADAFARAGGDGRPRRGDRPLDLSPARRGAARQVEALARGARPARAWPEGRRPTSRCCSITSAIIRSSAAKISTPPRR